MNLNFICFGPTTTKVQFYVAAFFLARLQKTMSNYTVQQTAATLCLSLHSPASVCGVWQKGREINHSRNVYLIKRFV
jgi:hypothetical protein